MRALLAHAQACAFVDMCCDGQRPDIVRTFWQYMNAAHILGYIGLSGRAALILRGYAAVQLSRALGWCRDFARTGTNDRDRAAYIRRSS